jgi:uncharacterized protein YuzE
VKTTYFENDDILQIRVSEKPIVREVSHGWNVNIAYAEDGSVVEIVLLDAKDLMPLGDRQAVSQQSGAEGNEAA